MRYTIEGFSQEELIKLKCFGWNDAIFLRWFVDFIATDKMEFCVYHGKNYYWISYEYVIQELPCLGITTKRNLLRRLASLQQRGLLDKHEINRFHCPKSYYRIRPNIMSRLISKKDNELQTSSDPIITRQLTSDKIVTRRDKKNNSITSENIESCNSRVTDLSPVENVQSQTTSDKIVTRHIYNDHSSSIRDSSSRFKEREVEREKKSAPPPPKTAYAEFVMLTQEEHTKLCDKLGSKGMAEYIDRLNLYKGSTGKRYKSDYFTILNWYHKDQTQQPTTPSRRYVSAYDESMAELRKAAKECQP